MRNQILVSIIALVAVLAFSSVALAQTARRETAQQESTRVDHTAAQPSTPPPDGWKTCPRCQNNRDRTEAWAGNKVDTHPFDPRDLSGVWGFDGVSGAFRQNRPPLTPWGQQQYDAKGQHAPPDRNSPELRGCDPLGYPRLYTYNYGFEFVMLPDRVLQFFEWGHTWRTIWTDGRKLPDNPPELRWEGYNVGRWEGDTFVIESNGYDERVWMSDEMRIVERYRRVNYGTLEAELTLIDPKTYTQPWVTPKATIKLVPNTELWEYHCVPSDEKAFDDLIHTPVSGGRNPR